MRLLLVHYENRLEPLGELGVLLHGVCVGRPLQQLDLTQDRVRQLLMPNSRFAKLPSPAIDWKIWKALYSHGKYNLQILVI